VNNEVQYESFEHLIEKDKAFNIFQHNFQTNLNGRSITFGDVVMGKISLNCSRCYNTEGKSRQCYSSSLPIYVGVALVLNSQICCFHCFPIEPVLSKMVGELNSIKHDHLEYVKLSFKDKSITVPEEDLSETGNVLPKILMYAPERTLFSEPGRFMAFGEGLNRLEYPYIIFGEQSIRGFQFLTRSCIGGYVPPSNISQNVDLYFVFSNRCVRFGCFSYCIPDQSDSFVDWNNSNNNNDNNNHQNNNIIQYNNCKINYPVYTNRSSF